MQKYEFAKKVHLTLFFKVTQCKLDYVCTMQELTLGVHG